MAEQGFSHEMSNSLGISYAQGGSLSICDEKRGRDEFPVNCRN
ncbi:hypothetical protein CHCC20335_1096 [Bacillus paralicheniformis]|nr:hypothetical protein CHCC20335_1096 [Bacillus paralicheniformis]